MARPKRPARARVATPARTQPSPGRWILLIPNLPPARASLRVKVWRRLQGVGAVGLKNSVYVLPHRDECVETFQWIAREIGELGGSAALCEGHFFDGVTDGEIEKKLVEARAADYAALGEEGRALGRALEAKRISAEKLAPLEAQLARLKRRFDEITAIDYGRAPERESAETRIRALERALATKRAPHQGQAPLAPFPRPRRATWVTRAGVHVDRIACAWLIRRFVDPDATFKWVAPKGYAPKRGEIRFDMFDAELTHVGDRCSFEVMIERMRLADPALAAIGEIVHDIDLRDEKFGRPETAGVRSQITGLCAAHKDDLARVAAATPMLDALYSFYALRARSSKGGTTP